MVYPKIWTSVQPGISPLLAMVQGWVGGQRWDWPAMMVQVIDDEMSIYQTLLETLK